MRASRRPSPNSASVRRAAACVTRSRCSTKTGCSSRAPTRRSEPHCEVRCFGHPLFEKMIAPYKACTGHAWIVDVPMAYFSWPDVERETFLDETVSVSIVSGPLASRAFAPLPVLGIPGWWPANDDPAFYDDQEVFRAGRRAPIP